MELKRLSITVSGRVRGVGFRYFTEDAAEALGLTGWVKIHGEGMLRWRFRGRRICLSSL